MTRQTATGRASTTATPATLWALLEDVSTWTTWAPFETAALERNGHVDPHGVGAIRRFQRGRFTTREQVTEFLPERRLSYRLLSGLPLRDYEAHIDLERHGDWTHITWSASFTASIPGTGRVFRRGMERLYADYARRLAGAAVERSARSQSPGRPAQSTR